MDDGFKFQLAYVSPVGHMTSGDQLNSEPKGHRTQKRCSYIPQDIKEVYMSTVKPGCSLPCLRYKNQHPSFWPAGSASPWWQDKDNIPLHLYRQLHNNHDWGNWTGLPCFLIIFWALTFMFTSSVVQSITGGVTHSWKWPKRHVVMRGPTDPMALIWIDHPH